MFTFVETRLFTRLVGEYLSDDEYLELQAALARNPEAGAVIPDSGGIRKLRWGLSGRGKRGGLRVIYYVRLRSGVIWMLTDSSGGGRWLGSAVGILEPRSLKASASSSEAKSAGS